MTENKEAAAHIFICISVYLHACRGLLFVSSFKSHNQNVGNSVGWLFLHFSCTLRLVRPLGPGVTNGGRGARSAPEASSKG